MLKLLTFLLGLVPLGYSVLQIYLLQTGGSHVLGADPAKELVLMQGEWAIRFLMLTLLVSPLRQVTGWVKVLTVRRMLGLFTFFYASLHLLAYAVLLLELDPGRIGVDLVKRPYITVGFAAWLLLVPLAATSNSWAIRRLKRRWQTLHRLVYAIAVVAVIHLFWLSKSSYLEAFVYGAILACLLVFRLPRAKNWLFPGAIKGQV